MEIVKASDSDALKVNNVINALDFSNFNQRSFDLFVLAVVEARQQGTTELRLSGESVRKKLGTAKLKYSTERLKREFKQACKPIASLAIPIFDDDDEWHYKPAFLDTAYYLGRDEYAFKFSREGYMELIEGQSQYILTSLSEYISLSGLYVKRLYILLKQWRCQQTDMELVHPLVLGRGGHHWSWEDFKRQLDIPKSYKTENIEQRIFKPALKQFQKIGVFKNLKITKLRGSGKGRPIEKIIITFDPESQNQQQQLSFDSAKLKNLEYAAEQKLSYSANFENRTNENLPPKILQKINTIKKINSNLKSNGGKFVRLTPKQKNLIEKLENELKVAGYSCS